MNNFIAVLYDSLFNYDIYQTLLDMVFDNLDYGKLGWMLILVSAISLTMFYKIWDPVKGAKLKWYLSLILIIVLCYAITSGILYNNPELLEYIGNYTGENGEVDADYFILQMSIISMVYALIISVVSSMAFFRLLSTNNRHNPF